MVRNPRRKSASQSLGNVEVVWQIFVPQLFVALGFILIAQVSGNRDLTLVNLVLFFYLLAASVVAHLRPYALDPTRFNAHMLTIIVGVCGGALILHLPANLGVFAPLACYFAALLPLRLAGSIGIQLATTVAGGAVIYLGMLKILHLPIEIEQLSGPAALLVVLAVVCGRWLMMDVNVADLNRNLHLRDSADWAKEDKGTASPRVFWAEGVGEDPIREEVLSDLIWRLPIVVLLVGGVTLSTALLTAPPSINFGLSWILIAVYQLWIFNQIPRQSRLNKLLGLGFLACLGVILWWGLLPLFEIGSRILTSVVLGGALGMIIALPWNRLWRSLVVLLTLSLGGLWISSAADPWLFCAWILFVVAVSWRASALQYLQILARSAMFSLLRFLERGPRSVDCVWAFAGHAAALFDAKRVLVLYEKSRAEIVEDGKVSAAPEKLKLHGEAVRAALKDTDTLDGLYVVRRMGEQVIEACELWFEGRSPKTIAFARLPGLIAGDQEEEAQVVIPIYRSATFLGVFRIFRHLSVLSGLARSWLAASRSKLRSSDVLLGTQQALNTKEEEFNETVHQVNNVAQEIAVQVDSLKRRLKDTNVWSGELEGILLHLEGGSRYLSSGVSDRKRLRELIQHRELVGSEVVRCSELSEELQTICRYLAERSNRSLRVDLREANLAVKVVNREYLETTLRLLLQLCERSSNRVKSLMIVIRADTGTVHFEFRANGGELDISGMERAVHEGTVGQGSETEILIGANKIAVASGGSLRLYFDDETGVDVITLSLPQGESRSAKIEPSGQWLLFVDDNPQVTVFYGRVAEALGLRYRSAASVDEAREILHQHGRPRLVVTDIRLGEASGLDLVRHIRKEFGGELPVVVVSGETAHEIAEQVEKSGATKFLSKPLGRGKLLAEIQEVLT